MNYQIYNHCNGKITEKRVTIILHQIIVLLQLNNLNQNTMTKRKIYHVIKTDNGWQSKLEGGQRASVKEGTKSEVVKQTIEIAKNQGNSSIKIHKSNGKFQEERTYPKKSDPFPPEG
jgi:hypothetical protein